MRTSGDLGIHSCPHLLHVSTGVWTFIGMHALASPYKFTYGYSRRDRSRGHHFPGAQSGNLQRSYKYPPMPHRANRTKWLVTRKE